MIRVHREPLVPLSLFDFRHVPGRDEERNDNARTSPTVEEEFQMQGTRVGKRDQKAGQTPTGAADGDFAEMGPVYLSLLSRKRAQAQEGLLANRPQAGHQTAQLHHASAITAVPDHLVDARSPQPGKFL